MTKTETESELIQNKIITYLKEMQSSFFDAIQNDLNLTRGQAIKALNSLKQKELVTCNRKFGQNLYLLKHTQSKHIH